MLAIAVNALFTTVRRRGTTRQLAWVIVTCVVSALLLLPAIVWYDLRFSVKQSVIGISEIEVLLGYVALCGWVVPFSVTSRYCLFSPPRTSNTSSRIPRLAKPGKQSWKAQQKSSALHGEEYKLPRYQAGVVAPYVIGEDTPWAWLEYRGGNFQGQRLALKRAVATIGRDEECDIWIDDDMASRYHAELAWSQDRAYLTDSGSLNGVLLNGKRVRGSVPIGNNDLIEIGTHCFTFLLAERQDARVEYDPLVNHKWRSTHELLSDRQEAIKLTTEENRELTGSTSAEVQTPLGEDTAELDDARPRPPQSSQGGAFIICDGVMAGLSFLVDRPVVTVGRSVESDIIINDTSISRQHVQFLRQADGDYVQDLGSRNGTFVNELSLSSPYLLQVGDIVRIGNIRLEYTSVEKAQETSLKHTVTPPPMGSGPISTPGLLSSPTPLRLPSRQK